MPQFSSRVLQVHFEITIMNFPVSQAIFSLKMFPVAGRKPIPAQINQEPGTVMANTGAMAVTTPTGCRKVIT
jgi:hypothetical protein